MSSRKRQVASRRETEVASRIETEVVPRSETKVVSRREIEVVLRRETKVHEILLKKLAKYGIIGLENTWFTSYLENRKQFCRVNGVPSNVNNINCGVPQGSCLGPLLFLIYINDLPFSLQNSQVTMYADDTTISYSSNNIDDINDNLNRDLNCLKQWLQGNKLSLNVIKTQAMVVGSRPNLKKISEGNVQSPSFAIGDSQIEIVEKTKYLGIQLDQHLVWDEHTRLLRAKVSRAIGFLKYAKTILPQETLSQIYRGIVEPHFRYCCSVWGSCGESRRLTLQKLQNRAARIVTNSSYDAPADALIQQLKWPNIAEIIKRETATIVYKSLNGLAPTYLSNIFSKNSSRRTVKLRNSETDLRIPLYKTSNGQNHSHIVVYICGTALNLRLSKHPLYMLLNIAFNLIVGGGMRLDWTGVGRILCLS